MRLRSESGIPEIPVLQTSTVPTALNATILPMPGSSENSAEIL
jgi:hypothetical protein